MKNFPVMLLLLVLSAGTLFAQQQEARLLRFPAVHGDQIVFTYAGDLYTVSSSGGTARKLTNDEGVELFPKFSPDGKQIAFTGQYDGNSEVYIIPSAGGVPKRVTWTATLGRDDVSDRMGPNNIVMDWKNNEEILFRSRWQEFNDWKGKLYLAKTDGSMAEQLPLPRGGFSNYSPDGKKLVYNRMFREFRTWKRYRGGQADDVWIYDFQTKKHENLTNNPAQDILPMWGSNNKIYYISDRDSRMNLFSYDPGTKETKKLTNYDDFDIKYPSMGDKALVFEKGGYIYKMDLAGEKPEKVAIYINEDFSSGRGGWIDVSKNVTNFEIAPDGKRALFGARGEVFTVPAKNGQTRNLTNSSGVHERNSKWSPDGKYIAFISDESGEDEIYITPQDGRGEKIQITKNSENYKYQILWSPDSKKILWGDRNQSIHYVDVESKSVTKVDESPYWEITSYDWSPDSRWITYGKPVNGDINGVYVYSLDSKKSTPVTDTWHNASGPVFSDDGKYLFFTSERTFSPTYGWTEWNHTYTDMTKIYFVTLSKDAKSPFEPKSDEVTIKDEGKKDEKKDEKKPDAKSVTVSIDFDGITDRVIELPSSAGQYFNLSVTGNKVFYMKRKSSDRGAKLWLYELDKQKETEIGEIGGYEISADKKKMLASNMGSYFIIDLPSGKADLKDKLDLSDMKMNLDRKAEWTQIYNEAWRQMRDFFYAPDMHGVDWEKMKKNYAPLVAHVNHRIDLTYIIGELIGELNAGHAYVGGGDYPKAERISLGLLGAQISRDGSGYYKINRIYKGRNWDKSLRSPLTEIGINAKEGDFIVAVNGVSTRQMKNIYEALVGTAGKQVMISLNSRASEDGAREVTVVPIGDEHDLLYYNWVQTNIEKVSKATDGKAGYVHIPDMGVPGLNEFVKYYYPQLEKEGLIIDVRGNGGGNVSPQIIERLQRKLTMIDMARNGMPGTNPSGMHFGPKVALADEFSASDGDIFSYRFKFHKLGKLIGKRTWGGVVGIRGSLPFVDGGFLNRPEFSRYDVEGKEWIMEGYGVDPDIYVDNDPALEYEGVDQQLDRAIEEIKNELKTRTKLPDPPPYPKKNK
ncbi:MAG: tricorn protease [Ignavibacteriales bacterium]